MKQEDFNYNIDTDSLIIRYLPTYLKYDNDIYLELINNKINYDKLKEQNEYAMWYCKEEWIIKFWEILKPKIHNILDDCIIKSNLVIYVNKPIIHFRCADTPFIKHRKYFFQKYEFFKKALEQTNNKNIILMTNSTHLSGNKEQDACYEYSNKLLNYLKKNNYNCEFLSKTNVEDFAMLFNAPFVISTSSSFSFMSGFFGKGKFISTDHCEETDNCYINNDNFIKGYNLYHKYVDSYYDINMNNLILYIIILFIFLLIFYMNNNLYENYENYNNIHFLSYGGPSENFHRALYRINLQAKELNVFETINTFNETDLKKENDFWKKHSNFIHNNKRGYGYWIWKPYLNYKLINNSKENDIIVYADAGCEINKNGKDKFYNYIDILNNSDEGILVFEMPQHLEKDWSKRDALIYLDCDKDEYTNTGQIFASWFMYKNCEKTRKIINEWYKICSNNYNLIDDSPSIYNNYDTFKENRHDQTIFSLLCKKYGCIKLLEQTNENEPIKVVRNRDG